MDNTIGQKIKAARMRAGFTQDKLGHEIGCKSGGITIRQWESGKRTPTIEGLKKVSDALDITIDYLLPHEWLSPEIVQSMSMTMNNYQILAARTINPELYPEQQLHHALHGMAGEVGEIHSLFQKTYQGHEIDPEHLKKELGDLLWMLAEACTAMNWSLDDVAQANIAKLRTRYPDGFSAEKSLHRKEGDV